MILTSYNNMNHTQRTQLFRIIRSKISDSDWREMLIDLILPVREIYESKTKDLVLFPKVIKALKSGNKTELKEAKKAAYAASNAYNAASYAAYAAANANAAYYAANAVYYAAHAAANAANAAANAAYAAKQNQQQILLKYLRKIKVVI